MPYHANVILAILVEQSAGYTLSDSSILRPLFIVSDREKNLGFTVVQVQAMFTKLCLQQQEVFMCSPSSGSLYGRS